MLKSYLSGNGMFYMLEMMLSSIQSLCFDPDLISLIKEICLHSIAKTFAHFLYRGFMKVFMVFYIYTPNKDSGSSLECPDEAVLTSIHNLYFGATHIYI